MKVKYYLSVGALSILMACGSALQLTGVEAKKNISVAQEIIENDEFVKVIMPYKSKLEKEMNQKISYTAVELNKSGQNSNLGAVLSDFLYDGAVEWAKGKGFTIDAVVLNAGGIRSNIPAGDILVKHIFEVMPFENEMVIVKMKGEDMQGLFQYYVKTQRNNPVSHLYIEVENNKLVKGLVNGEEPRKGKDYYIATSDYLALGGDYMTFFAKGELIRTNVKLRDLFMEYFKKTPEVKANTDIRLKFRK
ncbi:MAG: 5'-nucleotidase [Flavobacteriaceae bacterium]|nr:5'-nucleotidase [Flavobacteriaceae bacterium]